MTVSNRQIRRLAFQVLFQIDARGEIDADLVRETLDVPDNFGDREVRKSFDLGLEAYKGRKAADDVMEKLAPGWPAARQPAVDRAILRLAHFEMTSGRTPGRIAVAEAVELAKEFGSEKSPGFVNALLDKVLKSLPAQDAPPGDPGPT
mgnify:CR=1 FL=1